MSFKLSTAAAALSLLVAAPVFAQGRAFPAMNVDGGDRDEFEPFLFGFTMAPFNSETIAHLELNLGGDATLALEGTFKKPYEEIDEKEMLETGENRRSKAKGVSLIFSRYTRPMSMSGFYWGVGAGYREEDVTWGVRPDAADPMTDYSLVDGKTQLLNHDARLTGTTGHMRGGWRYVGQSVPLMGGVFLGVRHFQAGAKDVEVKRDEEIRIARMTDQEKERLRRKYSTRPEIGVEFGLHF